MSKALSTGDRTHDSVWGAWLARTTRVCMISIADIVKIAPLYSGYIRVSESLKVFLTTHSIDASPPRL